MIVDLHPPEVIADIMKNIFERGAYRFLAKHTHKDGHPIDVEVSVHLVRIGDEEFFPAFSHPITEQLEREKALRESENKFRAIFDQTSTLISLLAPDGSVNAIAPCWNSSGRHRPNRSSLHTGLDDAWKRSSTSPRLRT